MKRRQFLKLLSLTPFAASIPALSSTRNPYVNVGEVVSHIGPSPGFIGSQVVKSVGKWDGVGYPVELWAHGFGTPRKVDNYYDVDLSNFLIDVPEGFWKNPGMRERYPNVHTYVRTQRYGESIHEAIEHLNMAHTDEWLIKY